MRYLADWASAVRASVKGCKKVAPHELRATLAEVSPETLEAVNALAALLLRRHPEAFVDDDAGDAADLAVTTVRAPRGGRLTRADANDFLARQAAAEEVEDLVKMALMAMSIIRLAGGVT